MKIHEHIMFSNPQYDNGKFVTYIPYGAFDHNRMYELWFLLKNIIVE